ncbi:hypothetical protein CCHR01_10691 [Colletotrichum chrysophilum]|uniref:Uncharacterized protein n=1 Tax=Colletotrichum chrysophilum TaxID=1836956 RepID=A0AAD9AEF8_9PEZI|nr:hypothetical protein CCHR01_10691 [Colletotrichum chrysophilum]
MNTGRKRRLAIPNKTRTNRGVSKRERKEEPFRQKNGSLFETKETRARGPEERFPSLLSLRSTKPNTDCDVFGTSA